MTAEHIDDPSEAAQDTISRAFGANNRSRLLAKYFDTAGDITTANAWQHVYRLLLWIDRTTAVAHCYESDKAQPGRAWYARSLAFHSWISRELQTSPSMLGEQIDWLFRAAVKDLANQSFANRASTYSAQRAPYEGLDFPEPGEDPGLSGIIRESLGSWMAKEPPQEEYRNLTRRITVYMGQENKRRNLVGEGFEDVIAAVIRRLPFSNKLDVRNRSLLHELPGFYAPSPNEKAKRVDLAMISGTHRTLISVNGASEPTVRNSSTVISKRMHGSNLSARTSPIH